VALVAAEAALELAESVALALALESAEAALESVALALASAEAALESACRHRSPSPSLDTTPAPFSGPPCTCWPL